MQFEFFFSMCEMKRFINKTQRVRRDKLNVNQKCTKFKVSFSILQTAVIDYVLMNERAIADMGKVRLRLVRYRC